MAVDPNGTANVAWRHVLSNKTARIEFDRCVPGSSNTVSCGTDTLVATINSVNGLNGLSSRVMSDPTMAINVRGPGTQQYGYIYLVWTAKRVPDPFPGPPTDTDIYFTLSNDGGATFLTPYAIPSATTSTDEFFPTIAVDSGNFVNVIFYRRTSTSTSQTANAFNAYVITTGNAGQSWSSPIKLNNGGNITALQDFIGDYIGLDANSHSTIHPVWLDTRRGQNDIYSTVVSGC